MSPNVQMGGKLVRCLGVVHATFTLNLKVAGYNLKRTVSLVNEIFVFSIMGISKLYGSGEGFHLCSYERRSLINPNEKT